MHFHIFIQNEIEWYENKELISHIASEHFSLSDCAEWSHSAHSIIVELNKNLIISNKNIQKTTFKF